LERLVQFIKTYTKRYLLIFPTETKNKNNRKFTFKISATKVSGSPMIGTHANNKDHTPNSLNLTEAVFI
tara:strand:+ start:271 stop:477 length:207 start_codon:yes stop_codon:yes gene_type:complete